MRNTEKRTRKIRTQVCNDLDASKHHEEDGAKKKKRMLLLHCLVKLKNTSSVLLKTYTICLS